MDGIAAARAVGLKLWVATACLMLAAFLVWITVICLFGRIEHRLTPRQIHWGAPIPRWYVPASPSLWLEGRGFEVLEDGQRLGPEVDDLETVEEEGRGAHTTRVETSGPGEPERVVLYFTASDGTHPQRNGKEYVVRFPRSRLRATVALVLACWVMVPLVSVRLWRFLVRLRPEERVSVDAAAAAALVVGCLYSAFAIQAWLVPSNYSWLLLVASAGLAPCLARLSTDGSVLTGWHLWHAGLLGWAAFTTLGGSSYASPDTAIGFLAVSAGGLVLYLGLRVALRRSDELGPTLFLILFSLSVGSSLARNSGFHLAGGLASLGLSPLWAERFSNPWTTKFVSHWVLVVAWCTLAAFGLGGKGCRRDAVLVGILGSVTIWLNGSKSALAALLLSAAVAGGAMLRPRAVRRLVVVALVLGVLSAPLLATIPWRVQSSLPSDRADGPLSAVEMDIRGGVWEFSRRLISLQPVQGWGFGASASLPGQQLTIAEALGVEPSSPDAVLSRHPALAGGHPHNAALLTWLDLGLVGALLLAGLLVAVGRSIAGVEEQRGTHAALLGLLTVTAVFLIFNYPAWEPEVASILWMTAVLAAAVLPQPLVSRRALLRSGAAVLLILAIGGSVLVYDRASRWLTARELRTQELVLDPEAGRLVLGDEVRDLEYSDRLDAGADLFEPGSGADTFIHGWAYGPPGAGAPEAVLVFVGSELAGVVWPERPSPEAFARSEGRDVRALVSGFLIRLEPERLDLSAPVTVVALRPDSTLARELPPLSQESGGESTAPGRGPG